MSDDAPADLIAYTWAESISTEVQSVLLTSELRRLQRMIDAIPKRQGCGHCDCACDNCAPCGEEENRP